MISEIQKKLTNVNNSTTMSLLTQADSFKIKIYTIN